MCFLRRYGYDDFLQDTLQNTFEVFGLRDYVLRCCLGHVIYFGHDGGDMIEQIYLDSLTSRQAFKFFLIHEKRRHLEDIIQIERDLDNLADVEVPDELLELAGQVRIEVQR